MYEILDASNIQTFHLLGNPVDRSLYILLVVPSAGILSSGKFSRIPLSRMSVVSAVRQKIYGYVFYVEISGVGDIKKNMQIVITNRHHIYML